MERVPAVMTRICSQSSSFENEGRIQKVRKGDILDTKKDPTAGGMETDDNNAECSWYFLVTHFDLQQKGFCSSFTNMKPYIRSL